MNRAEGQGKRILIVLYLLAIHVLAGFFIYDRFIAPYFRTDKSYSGKVNSPTEETPVPTIIPVPSVTIENTNTGENSNLPENANNSANNPVQDANTNPNPIPNNPPADSQALMIPVKGIKREQLQDTFSSARSDGRVHDAIDIIAPAGTPVVAAANGEIAKFFDSKPGGITVYQYSADKTLVYYYAHLERRADNLREKDYVTQGTVIGYVGDTGNAGAGNYHLHFSIARLKDPKRWWEGEYINPFPLLRNGIEAR